MANEVRRPAYLELAAAIRRDIVAGHLAAGERLPVEPQLSAQYGVSRSTVREALRLLSSQNLITTTRGVAGGSFVVHPKVDQLSESLELALGLLTVGHQVTMASLLELRELLEVPAAGLAAARRTEAQVEALRRTLLDPETAPAEDLLEANVCFHTELFHAAGNPLLGAVASPIFTVLNERLMRENAPAVFWTQILDDHREIASRVIEGDVEAAREASRRHLDHLRSTYEAIDRVT